MPHVYGRYDSLISFWYELFASKVPTLPNICPPVREEKISGGKSTDHLDYKNMVTIFINYERLILLMVYVCVLAAIFECSF